VNDRTNQPDPGPDVIARLAVDYAHLQEAVDAYDAEAAELPTEVLDDSERHRFAEMISRMQKTAKHIESVRTAEKAPYLASERAVDGFFFAIARKLNEVTDDLNNCLTAYLNRLREQERARQEAEAAEARRRAKEAEEEAAKARAAARDEDDARRRRQANEEASRKTQEADRHTASAMAASQLAEQKPAAVVRGRSESGKLSTLRTTWVGEIIDIDELDMDRLRPFFTRSQLEQAVRAYVKAGHRELKGASIVEMTSAQVRG